MSVDLGVSPLHSSHLRFEPTRSVATNKVLHKSDPQTLFRTTGINARRVCVRAMLDDNQTVFHLVSGDADDQELTLTLAENLTKDDTIDMDDVAILAQAEGIDPVTADGDQSDHVQSLIEDGVSVKACSNTLDMFDLTEADLVEGVETVSSGVGELTRLQNDGYAYIST